MARARATQTYLVYVNAVGGQDELVFDGGSLVISPKGQVLARGVQFEEQLLIVSILKRRDCFVAKNAPRNRQGGL